ncbi:hypothetical protein WA026_004472 [Henosepilachna vigintioctopunctata]|uniref:tRNA (uracil(54)-C(5))-methyltransferase n=1 Tax=Henosepilachna vigintioctopunctata TaxID=420089 RepID=A0AAW1V902_9CUCU
MVSPIVHFTLDKQDLLGSVCYNSQNYDIIAILDPPRAGLHQKAIPQIRKVKKIKRVLYVSCNPEGAFKNFLDLGRPKSKTLHGNLCSKHRELVIQFERIGVVEKK